MDIIAWAVIGGVAGWITSLITRDDGQVGVGSNLAAGIIGALLGGWLVTLFGGPTATGFDAYSFLVAALGAIVFLGLVNGTQRTALR